MDRKGVIMSDTQARPTDISGINHTGLHVRDVERSIAFYRDLIGLELLTRRQSRADYVADIVGYPGAIINMAWLRHPSGGPIIELLEYVEPAGQPVDTATANPGTAHVCFSVPDIQATYRRLKAAGVRFKSDGPVAITAGANQGGYAIYFTDPDGITLELIQPRPD
jgi:catechol 2,3-dioxygenase-like lactoylglutathione lyase family enzyme